MSEVGRITFNGLYRHALDDKRRIQVPAKWRPTEPGTELTVAVWQKHKEGPCLRVLPPEKQASLLRSIEAMPNDHPAKSSLKRLIGEMSVQVTLDSAGRICLPEEMVKAAGIMKETVLAGVLDAFEIWEPARHERVRQADAVNAMDAFKYME